MNYITIPGFTDLTEREAIEISARHVFKNRRPSRGPDGTGCLYDGCGCAAAPFILPEHRKFADRTGDDQELMDSGWTSLVEAEIVQPHLRRTIRQLQECHDEAARDLDDTLIDINDAAQLAAFDRETFFLTRFKYYLVDKRLVGRDDPLLQE